MKTHFILLLSGILCLASFSCSAPVAEAPPAPDLDQIRGEIQGMEDAYAVAQNAKDVEGIMS